MEDTGEGEGRGASGSGASGSGDSGNEAGGSGASGSVASGSGTSSGPPIVPGIVVEDPLHPANQRTAKKRQDQMAASGCFEAGNCIYLKRPANETNRLV